MNILILKFVDINSLLVALDAYCLIEIYDVIEKQVTKIGQDFNEVINTFLTEKKPKFLLKKNNQNNGASSFASCSHKKKVIDNNCLASNARNTGSMCSA